MHTVTLDEAKKSLVDLVEEASNGGEIVILKGSEPAAKLVAVDTHPVQRRFGSARGKVTMSKDFDEPLADFTGHER